MLHWPESGIAGSEWLQYFRVPGRLDAVTPCRPDDPGGSAVWPRWVPEDSCQRVITEMDAKPEIRDIYLGRQPILDRNQNLVAFELQFRPGLQLADQSISGTLRTANTIVNAFSELGIPEVLGKRRGFIHVDKEILLTDLIHLLPREQVVLQLSASSSGDDAVVKRCEQLKDAGFRLALNEVNGIDAQLVPLLKLMDAVKLDLLQIKSGQLPEAVAKLKIWPALLAAESVATIEQAKQCMDLGFDLFQGYYFARPQILTGKRTDPSKMSLLRLQMLISNDAEVADIERELKHYPALAYNLIRMVNSVAFGRSHKISALKQAVVVLGRRQLQRWVQMLLYTAGRPESNLISPLMQLAATRGKLLESIAALERGHDMDYQGRAFMVGILSPIDALLGLPLPEIIAQLNLMDEVNAALLKREGSLGRMLDLAEKMEANDLEGITGLLQSMPFLTLIDLTQAELDAVVWVNRIGETIA